MQFFFSFTKDFATEFWYGSLIYQSMKYGGMGGGWKIMLMIFSLFEQFSFINKISQSLSKVFYSTNRSLPSILAGESSVTKSRKLSLTGALHYVILCTGIIRAFDLGSFWIWQLPVLKSRYFTITFDLWKQSGHLEEVKSGYYQSKYI